MALDVLEVNFRKKGDKSCWRIKKDASTRIKFQRRKTFRIIYKLKSFRIFIEWSLYTLTIFQIKRGKRGYKKQWKRYKAAKSAIKKFSNWINSSHNFLHSLCVSLKIRLYCLNSNPCLLFIYSSLAFLLFIKWWTVNAQHGILIRLMNESSEENMEEKIFFFVFR